MLQEHKPHICFFPFSFSSSHEEEEGAPWPLWTLAKPFSSFSLSVVRKKYVLDSELNHPRWQFKISLSCPVVNIFEPNSVWHNRGTDSCYGNRQTSTQLYLQELFGKSNQLEALNKLVVFLDD